MSRSLVGFVVDTLEFAREARSLEGVVSVASLPRLLDLLAETGQPLGELSCSMVGRSGRDGHWLHLRVQGHIDLTCQRCLGAMPFVLAVDTELQVIGPGETWPDEELEDGATHLGADAIAAEEAQLLTDLIEEEVLLALPIAPRHENCAPPARSDVKEAASPFAVLAQLKKH